MALKLNPFLSSSDSFKFRRFVPPAPAAASAVRGGTCRFPKFVMASTLGSGTTSISAREIEKDKKPFMPPREIHVQVTHSMPPQRIEVFKSLEDLAENIILAHLKPVEKCWQPPDFLST